MALTVRALEPEMKPRVLVSDTVGFIRKLPHDLVASFRSTLEEAAEGELLLHVVHELHGRVTVDQVRTRGEHPRAVDLPRRHERTARLDVAFEVMPQFPFDLCHFLLLWVVLDHKKRPHDLKS